MTWPNDDIREVAETAAVAATGTGPRRVSRWRKIWRAMGATLAAATVYFGAMAVKQPDVPVQAAPPIQAVSATEYRTTADYQTTVDGVTVRIRAGFRFDGASIPPAAWTLLGLEPFSGTVVRAGLVHDALYASELTSKETADRLFKLALIENGTNKRKAEACWAAVRDWGWTAWDRHTYESIVEARRFVSIGGDHGVK